MASINVQRKWTGKIVPFSQVRIGQYFSWVPPQWFGPARLTVKTPRPESEIDWRGGQMHMRRVMKYDIKYDAKVVNPPGIDYGVHADTDVRLLGRPLDLEGSLLFAGDKVRAKGEDGKLRVCFILSVVSKKKAWLTEAIDDDHRINKTAAQRRKAFFGTVLRSVDEMRLYAGY